MDDLFCGRPHRWTCKSFLSSSVASDYKLEIVSMRHRFGDLCVYLPDHHKRLCGFEVYYVCSSRHISSPRLTSSESPSDDMLRDRYSHCLGIGLEVEYH